MQQPTQQPISDHDLEAALAAFPDYLADDTRTWIRGQEQAGRRWPSVLEAVRDAMQDALDEAQGMAS